MFKKLLVFILIAGVFASCLKSKETEGLACTYDTCANKAPASEIAQVEAYLASQNITNAIKHCSGVYYTIVSAGGTPKPTACSAIVASYEGKLTNGNTFDQGQFPSYYRLTDLVKGWTNTVPMIGVGGTLKLYIPPTLGYGSQPVTNPQTGAVIIPANSILIFDLSLVAFQ
ncbi:MAG: FKBP-type peptidylprolyl isomerase [Flaviaesturariibacter sp.]|nr:FKBP-type peptidylprolyl isomerase [Flaviaesturariibacter sp.]